MNTAKSTKNLENYSPANCIIEVVDRKAMGRRVVRLLKEIYKNNKKDFSDIILILVENKKISKNDYIALVKDQQIFEHLMKSFAQNRRALVRR